MRLQTSKKYNGPNVCRKTILENFYAYDIDIHFLFIDLQKLLTTETNKHFTNHYRVLGYPKTKNGS